MILNRNRMCSSRFKNINYVERSLYFVCMVWYGTEVLGLWVTGRRPVFTENITLRSEV